MGSEKDGARAATAQRASPTHRGGGRGEGLRAPRDLHAIGSGASDDAERTESGTAYTSPGYDLAAA